MTKLPKLPQLPQNDNDDKESSINITSQIGHIPTNTQNSLEEKKNNIIITIIKYLLIIVVVLFSGFVAAFLVDKFVFDKPKNIDAQEVEIENELVTDISEWRKYHNKKYGFDLSLPLTSYIDYDSNFDTQLIRLNDRAKVGVQSFSKEDVDFNSSEEFIIDNLEIGVQFKINNTYSLTIDNQEKEFFYIIDDFGKELLLTIIEREDYYVLLYINEDEFSDDFELKFSEERKIYNSIVATINFDVNTILKTLDQYKNDIYTLKHDQNWVLEEDESTLTLTNYGPYQDEESELFDGAVIIISTEFDSKDIVITDKSLFGDLAYNSYVKANEAKSSTSVSLNYYTLTNPPLKIDIQIEKYSQEEDTASIINEKRKSFSVQEYGEQIEQILNTIEFIDVTSESLNESNETTENIGFCLDNEAEIDLLTNSFMNFHKDKNLGEVIKLFNPESINDDVLVNLENYYTNTQISDVKIKSKSISYNNGCIINLLQEDSGDQNQNVRIKLLVEKSDAAIFIDSLEDQSVLKELNFFER